MCADISKIIIPIGVTLLSTATVFIADKGGDFFNLLKIKIQDLFSGFKLKEREQKIILKLLEQKYQKLKDNLSDLAHSLIKGKDFLKKIEEDIKKLVAQNSNLKKIISQPKKIILLGDSGVGKSTLINCIEEKKLAIEAKKKFPTTMKYEEYKSTKYKNFIFCDTRGTETDKFKEIEASNIENILENIKGINFYLFWYLIAFNDNFQESDAKYIKSIQKSLNNNMSLFFIITRTSEPEEEKSNLEDVIKEFFPDNKNIQVFPVLARGPKKNPEETYGLTELMNETKKFFNNIIIKDFFRYIYQEDKKFDEQFSNLLNKSSIEKLFILILKRIRLEDYLNSNSLNNDETSLINNFLEEKYLSFLNSNGKEIVDLCLLIKAKYEIIDVDNVEETTKRLTNLIILLMKMRK